MATDQTTQQQVNQTAWSACDTFRGVVDAGQYKDYILVMLFLKYISDLWNDHIETYKKQYGDDDARIRRRLERERFVLPEGAFQCLSMCIFGAPSLRQRDVALREDNALVGHASWFHPSSLHILVQCLHLSRNHHSRPKVLDRQKAYLHASASSKEADHSSTCKLARHDLGQLRNEREIFDMPKTVRQQYR